MKATVKAVVALDTGADRDHVAALLSGDPELEILDIVEGLEASWTVLASAAADLVVVACEGYSESALSFIGGSVRQWPERPVVVLCGGSPNGFVRRVFEAGADDILSLSTGAGDSSPADVTFALQKAFARKNGLPRAGGAAPGAMICVLGPKGGIGKTLIASNLAAALAGTGEKVAMVDLDLQFGDLGLALGLKPGKTIYDLATSSGSLDEEKLDAYLAPHDSGVRALLAPTRPDHAGAITAEFLDRVYATLRSTNDYIVVDTAPGFTSEVLASIDSSSHVCVVGMLDALALQSTKLALETLELMGYEEERIRLVLNRADSRVGITHEDVVTIVGREPDLLVPSDREITRSISAGSPIVLSEKRSEAAKAFRSLAALYSSSPPPAISQKRRGRSLLARRKS
jgi:pilus assembly protein CpaE